VEGETELGACGRPLPSPFGATFPRKREKELTAGSVLYGCFITCAGSISARFNPPPLVTVHS